MSPRALLPIALGLALTGPALLRAAPPASGPRVELRLAVTPATWKPGERPRLDLTFVNRGDASVRVVSPLDGSWDGARDPSYALELLDETGAVLPDVLGPAPPRCGLTNKLRPQQDILALAPGARTDAHASPNSFPFDLAVADVARPGRYRARVRYRTALAGATRLDLTSNLVEIEISGTDMSLWTCFHDQAVRRARGGAYTTHEPLSLRATDGGFALLYRRVDVTQDRAGERRQGGLVLQRLGPGGAPGPAIAVAAGKSLGAAQSVAATGGLLVVHGLDERHAPGGRQSLRAALVRDDGRVDPPVLLDSDLASAYHLALERSGDRIAALYLRTRGDADEVALQRLDAGGVAQGPAIALARGVGLGDPLLVPDGAGGFVAIWTEAQRVRAATIDPQGKVGAPRLLADRLGALAGAASRPDGLQIAFHKNYTQGSDPTDRMGFYLRSFPDAGAPGPALALSPAARDDAHWGQVAWGRSIVARAYERDRLDRLGRAREPADLMAGAVGAPALRVAVSLLGTPVIAARGDDLALAWADARDDASQVCARVGACVGEIYVALGRGGRLGALTPVRLTTAALARPEVAPEHQWRELCP